jgi:hypothetical protein
MLCAAPGLRFWTGVRAVEGAALEMLCRSNPTVGSNPTLSVSWGRYSRLLSRYYEVSKDMIAKIKALYDYSIFPRVNMEDRHHHHAVIYVSVPSEEPCSRQSYAGSTPVDSTL